MPWLRGAVRDAGALHALFLDSLGGDARLLTDDQATGEAIRTALRDLADESTDSDVVVLTFSGHGTDTHRLVVHDTDANDLPGTSLGLDEFAELLSAIPGRTLFCALDCCFSGGLGARIFSPELQPRSAAMNIPIDILDRFVGDGRVVLTASADDQEAYESPRHGHGLLTYRLIEALQGVDSVLEGNQVNLYRLVNYVTEQVQADAQKMGHVQTPALRGRVEGIPFWPRMAAGERFAELFPNVNQPLATPDVESLIALGFREDLVEVWRGAVRSLNDLQLAAINDHQVLAGHHLVVTAPTSSGKTMIGELAALHAASRRRRTVFLLPMRALVNDKYRQFTGLYDPLGIRTIRATGEHSDDVPALLGGHFDVALLTYEKYSALALGFPHLLDLVDIVVVDEAQILADAGRGANLEFLLTLLNKRRSLSGGPQLITLSAVVGDLDGLDVWLGAGHLHSDVRPVDLKEGVVEVTGQLKYLDTNGAEQTEEGFIQPLPAAGSRRLLIPLVERLVIEGKKVIVFRQSKGEAVACSVYLSQTLQLPAAEEAIDLLPDGDQSTTGTTLRQTLAGGVACHSTDLSREERLVVEESFTDPESPLRVVVATPTLAMGVNTPASAVAIVGLTHPGPTPTAYSVAEYKNMVGRAGRLGFTEAGESYLLPEGRLSSHAAWGDYVLGSLEPLRSKLVPDGDPRTLMLRVLASVPGDTTAVLTEKDVIDFLDLSLAAHQARRDPGLTQWTTEGLRRGFEQLENSQLIEEVGDGYRLTPLGRFAGESGIHVDSIVRLVQVLRPVADGLNSVGLIAAAQCTVELDDVYMPVNARGRRTEHVRWPQLLGHQGVPPALVTALRTTAIDIRTSVQRPKRAAAAAMWIAGEPTDRIEIALTQHMPQRGGISGAVRAVTDRTRDLLPAVAAVIHQLAPHAPVDELTERTMLRLELGIPAEMLLPAQLGDVELPRAVWLELCIAGLNTVDDVLAVAIERLSELVGSRTIADRLLNAARAADISDTEEIDLPVPAE